MAEAGHGSTSGRNISELVPTHQRLGAKMEFRRFFGKVEFRIPVTCYDIAVTRDDQVLLAARQFGMLVYSGNGEQLSSWLPPKQSHLEDVASCVAALSDGQAAVGVAFAHMVVLLTNSQEDSTWHEVHRVTMHLPPLRLAAYGDLIAASQTRLKDAQRLQPELALSGGHMQVQRLSSGAEICRLTKEYDIEGIALTAFCVVITSSRTEKQVVEALSHAGEPVWQRVMDNDEIVEGICAAQTRNDLYMCVLNKTLMSSRLMEISGDNGYDIRQIWSIQTHGMLSVMSGKMRQVAAVLSCDPEAGQGNQIMRNVSLYISLNFTEQASPSLLLRHSRGLISSEAITSSSDSDMVLKLLKDKRNAKRSLCNQLFITRKPEMLSQNKLPWSVSQASLREHTEMFPEIEVSSKLTQELSRNVENEDVNQLRQFFHKNYRKIRDQMTLEEIKKAANILYSRELISRPELNFVLMEGTTAAQAATILLNCVIGKNAKKVYSTFLDTLTGKWKQSELMPYFGNSSGWKGFEVTVTGDSSQESTTSTGTGENVSKTAEINECTSQAAASNEAGWKGFEVTVTGDSSQESTTSTGTDANVLKTAEINESIGNAAEGNEAGENMSKTAEINECTSQAAASNEAGWKGLEVTVTDESSRESTVSTEIGKNVLKTAQTNESSSRAAESNEAVVEATRSNALSLADLRTTAADELDRIQCEFGRFSYYLWQDKCFVHLDDEKASQNREQLEIAINSVAKNFLSSSKSVSVVVSRDSLDAELCSPRIGGILQVEDMPAQTMGMYVLHRGVVHWVSVAHNFAHCPRNGNHALPYEDAYQAAILEGSLREVRIDFENDQLVANADKMVPASMPYACLRHRPRDRKGREIRHSVDIMIGPVPMVARVQEERRLDTLASLIEVREQEELIYRIRRIWQPKPLQGGERGSYVIYDVMENQEDERYKYVSAMLPGNNLAEGKIESNCGKIRVNGEEYYNVILISSTNDVSPRLGDSGSIWVARHSSEAVAMTVGRMKAAFADFKKVWIAVLLFPCFEAFCQEHRHTFRAVSHFTSVEGVSIVDGD